MRLSTLAPSPPALVSSLAECGITTENHLLFSHTIDEIFRKLPPDTTSFRALKEYVALVAERASASQARADSLLGEPNVVGNFITTGVSDLDNLLTGMGSRNVIEISGDVGSGKTTLAIHAVLRHLATHEHAGAIWLDTTGDFNVARLPSVLHLYDEQSSLNVLERLQVSLILDFDAAYTVLETIRANMLMQVDSPKTTTHYIVIDSITELFGPLLSAVSSQGHALMTAFLRQLRTLAQESYLTVLVINNATMVSPNNPYSAFATTVKKPALGPSFTYLTDATIWLARSPNHRSAEQESATHIAEIFRSKIGRSRRWCSFKICRGLLVLS